MEKLTWESAGNGIRFYEHQTRTHKGKPDKCYYIRYKVDGKPVSEKVGWESEGITLKTAQELRGKLLTDHRQGTGPSTLKESREIARTERLAKEEEAERQKRESLTLGDFFQHHFEPWAKANKKSCQSDLIRFRVHLENGIGKKSMREIDALALERLKKDLRAKGLANATVRHCLQIVRACFNKAREWKLADVIFPKVKMPKLDNMEYGTLSPEEEALLMPALRKGSWQTWAMAMVSLYSGARFSEVANLTWGRVDFDQGLLVFTKTKGKKDRRVPMAKVIREILEAHRGEPGELVFPSEIGGVMDRASVFFSRTVERLGLNRGKEERFKIKFHSLRRSWATRLLEKGVSLSVIRDLGGWADLTILSRYLSSDLNGHRDAIALLDQAPTPANGIIISLGA